MTRDDVIRMARTAGSSPYTNRHFPERPFHTFSPEAIERFAALVATHEREECAKVADRHSTCENDTPDVIAVAIRARGTQ